MSLAREAAVFASQPPNRKNLIINGCFRVWQRGITFVGAGTLDYPADRWELSQATAAVINTSQAVVADPDLPYVYKLIVSPTTADTSMGATDSAGLNYSIEGYDCAHLRQGTTGAETVTLSFWHEHTKTGIHSGSIRNADATRSWVFEYTQSVADEPEFTQITIPLCTTGTWNNANGTGMQVRFCMAVGSTYSTAVTETWGTSNYVGSSNQVNNFDSTSNYFRIANVQLELGSEATDFEQRMLAEELALCQRYCLRVIGANDGGYGFGSTTTVVIGYIPLPVPFRGVPTLTGITISDVKLRGGAGILTPTEASPSGVGKGAQRIDFTTTGVAVNDAYALYANSTEMILDCEL